ncbi:phosphoenolpyruvate carboxylase [Glaciecola sp. XM2]|uniref:phosphoenolpyruvate carboxylase n=1 Tax=Glaciecola sp. XM2 TaxID=1914931 RepID=UPI001BDF2AA9|nr:phosphoenolpyruvate carboxylase [Glaciecola sp. XM2]MBT1451089.1 phosphoenolpyruvate carboxylase [Glaciecola sp. XM2]
MTETNLSDTSANSGQDAKDVLSAQLRETIKYLGATLGETIEAELGSDWLALIEQVRHDGRHSSKGNSDSTARLAHTIAELDNQSLLTIGRAFAQFLNLANIAEQEFNTVAQKDESLSIYLNQLIENAKSADDEVSQASILKAIEQLNIDLVLTAHPTEVTRRTLIHKHRALAAQLQKLHNANLTEVEERKIRARIGDLIAQAWHTEEIRSIRPTPVDEARWGYSVIESSLWEAIPDFLRDLDDFLQTTFKTALPLDAKPVQFSSWMGGDRDGNPFVTSKVTEEVLLRARRRAAKLFLQDLNELYVELSMNDCDDALRAIVGDVKEPYREILRPLVHKMEITRDGRASEDQWLQTNEELLRPLTLCYQSLLSCGMQVIANGALLDTIRRAHAFGMHLLKLDIRQDSQRHADVFSELTRYLGLGDYNQWSEVDKQAFLLRELASRRPLMPPKWSPSEEVQEVLDTCKVIAKHGKAGFGIYIISMASEPSDVLAVQLLLKECGVDWPMPVAPLFETLDDLNHSPKVMHDLLNIDWYRGYINGRQYVMIGYSDSAKDAGSLAAGWSQYSSQEALVDLAKEQGVQLTLFHGRGGTIGRGGLPAKAAIHSQPPGSLTGGFRVTEQGETIRYKFGMPQLAKRSLSIYASAVVEAIVSPPPAPEPRWRELISQMAEQGCENYRKTVRYDKEFVPYFRVATPEQELGKLPLGSRPAKRKPSGGIESLRAIPWIFAWAQTRLVLPSWLGVMRAVQTVNTQENQQDVQNMIEQWPFFASRLSMLDMVFKKADPSISEAYDKRLVPAELVHFGEALREELKESMQSLLQITGHEHMMEDDPLGRNSMNIRAGYLQPLHYLQIELLDRIRKAEASEFSDDDVATLERAMMVAITGIAVGIRNTG